MQTRESQPQLAKRVKEDGARKGGEKSRTEHKPTEGTVASSLNDPFQLTITEYN